MAPPKVKHQEKKIPIFGANNPTVPDEIGLKVFTYLDSDDLFNVAFVSRRWEALALHDNLWKSSH